MPKPIIIIILLLIPALCILAGWYFTIDLLMSIGYVILIFYVIMAIRANFASGKKNNR